MALINCKECGRGISTSAKSCPHCGYDNTNFWDKTSKSLRRLSGYLLLTGGVFGLIFGLIFNNSTLTIWGVAYLIVGSILTR